MKIEKIELYAITRGFYPMCVIFAKGRKIKWFVCVERHEPSQSERFVVFDADGRAFLTSWMEESKTEEMKEAYNITVFDDSLLIFNHEPAHRDTELDYHEDENS